MNKAICGWSVDGITTFQSGFPVILTAQPTILSSDFGGRHTAPNYVSGCAKSVSDSALSKTLSGYTWFNTICFTQPGSYSFGNEPAVDPDLRQQDVANWDFALFKQTAISDRFELQFRAEFFNLFNRVQFGYPSLLCCNTISAVTAVRLNSQGAA